MDVATLVVKLEADTKEALANLGGMTSKLQDIGKNMKKTGDTMTKFVTGPILALTGGMFALASKTGDYADRILDLTEITGMSAQSIQEWQHVAKIAGVSTETVTNAVEGLVRRLPQLEAEGGRSTEQLAKLGLTFDDLNKMKPDEMVDTLINSLSQMEDPLERNAIGASLFGGAWKDIAPILSLGADEIENLKIEANELGGVMSDDALNGANDFRVEIEKLKTEFGAIFRELATKFLPVLKDDILPLIRSKIIPAISDFADMIGRLFDWYKKLSPELQTLIGGFVVFLTVLGPILSVVGSILMALPILATVFGFLVSPVGLVVLAIGGLIAIGIALWKNWDTIKEKAFDVWNKIKETFDKFKEIDLFEVGKNIIKSLWEGLVNFWNEVKDRVSQIGTSIADAMAGKTISTIDPRTNLGAGGLPTGNTGSGGTNNTVIINGANVRTPAEIAKETQKTLRNFAIGYQ